MTTPSRHSTKKQSGLSIGQRLFAHGGVYTASRFINQGMGFFLIPIYARYLGDEGYGIVNLVAPAGAFFTLVVLQGLHAAWFRLRFDYHDAQSLRRFESTVLWYICLSIVVGLGLAVIFGESLAHVFTPGVPFYPFGFLTILAGSAAVFAELYERKAQAEERPVAFTLFSGFRTLLMFLAIIFFVVVLKRGARGQIEAGVVIGILFGCASWFLIRPGSPRWFSFGILRGSLDYGLRLFPHTLALQLNQIVDRILVSLQIGLAATGVYSLGANIALVASIFAMSLNQAYAPLFLRAVTDSMNMRKHPETVAGGREGLDSVARSGLLLVLAVGCFSLLLTAVSREAILVMATPAFGKSWTVVAPLCAGVIVYSCYFVFTHSIFFHKKEVRLMVLVSILGACVCTVGALYLIPKYQILGGAWARLASAAAMALLALRIGQKVTPIPHRWRRYALVLFALSAGLVGLWATDWYFDQWVPRVLLKLVITSIAIASAISGVGLRIAEMWNMMQYIFGAIRSRISKA